MKMLTQHYCYDIDSDNAFSVNANLLCWSDVGSTVQLGPVYSCLLTWLCYSGVGIAFVSCSCYANLTLL
jgi:hypothetical protein